MQSKPLLTSAAIGAVAAGAQLSKGAVNAVAAAAQGGDAQAVCLAHTPSDGNTSSARYRAA